ncbi:thymidylate synthase complementing protein [Citromicrobium phage vB_CbaS-RXM]|nr:thymidylate synthase complementing protein [Citromicrobium phage vB_CbaS-RXM]
MTTTAKVITDSIGEYSPRLLTLELEYPRFIHAEVMTHRVFSRNASSSRAIPTKRMHRNILDNPALPASFRMNEPGMQGYTEAPPQVVDQALEIIERHRLFSIETAEALDALGLHKQNVNRYTEAHQHIKVVLTSCQWDNFDWLRIHHAADPTMIALADAIYAAREASTPKMLKPGEWHLSYITESDYARVEQMENKGDLTDLAILLRVSAARCARVSYNNFEGKPTTLEEDLALYEKLIKDFRGIVADFDPLHASPVEHQATPDRYLSRAMSWDQPALHGNLPGWVQHRKLIPGENMEGYKWQPLL